MLTGMSLPSFASATSRGYRGVSQANYGLKLTSRLAALVRAQSASEIQYKASAARAPARSLNLFVRRHVQRRTHKE